MQVIVSPLVPDQDPINITMKYFCQSKKNKRLNPIRHIKLVTWEY